MSTATTSPGALALTASSSAAVSRRRFASPVSWSWYASKRSRSTSREFSSATAACAATASNSRTSSGPKCVTSPSRPATSRHPITWDPARRGTTIASFAPHSRNSLRRASSPSFAPTATVSPVATTRFRSDSGAPVTSISPRSSTRAESRTSG